MGRSRYNAMGTKTRDTVTLKMSRKEGWAEEPEGLATYTKSCFIELLT